MSCTDCKNIATPCSNCRYTSNLQEAKSFGIRKGMINGISMGVVYGIVFGSYALGFWYGSKLVRDGEYTGGNVLIVS